MQTITIAGGRDLALFRGLLQSLVANDLSAWRIFIQVDPSPLTEHYIDAAANILGGFEYALTVNPRCLGTQENSFRLLEYVFRHSSSVNINLAEDTLAAADVTDLAQWYFDHHQPEWLCLSLLSMSWPVEVHAHTAYRNLLFPGKEFNSSGFVVRREEWYQYFQNTKSVNGKALARLDEDFLVGWVWAICKHLLGTTDLGRSNRLRPGFCE